MAITTRMSGTVTIVQLQGMMTADHGVREFGDRIRTLLENGHTHIVVNCADVPHFDSAGLSEFVKAYTAVSLRGGAIKILHLRKGFWVWSLMAITKLLPIFETYDDEAAAIASFGGDKA
jgi:anti-anti-sigma factor